MSDTRTGLLTALYDRLKNNVGPGVAVYSDIAAIHSNAATPLVLIEDVQSENIGSKGSALDRYTVTIAVPVEAKTHAGLATVMAAVRLRLEHVVLTLTGYVFWAAIFEGDDVSTGLDETGLAKVGRLRFTITVQPA